MKCHTPEGMEGRLKTVSDMVKADAEVMTLSSKMKQDTASRFKEYQDALAKNHFNAPGANTPDPDLEKKRIAELAHIGEMKKAVAEAEVQISL